MRRQISWPEKTVATLALLLVIGAFFYIYFVVSAFEELFRGMDVVKPQRTQFALDTYLYWLVFPLVGLTGNFLVCLYGNRRGWYLVVTSVLAAIILFPFTVWAMYGFATG